MHCGSEFTLLVYVQKHAKFTSACPFVISKSVPLENWLTAQQIGFFHRFILNGIFDVFFLHSQYCHIELKCVPLQPCNCNALKFPPFVASKSKQQKRKKSHFEKKVCSLHVTRWKIDICHRTQWLEPTKWQNGLNKWVSVGKKEVARNPHAIEICFQENCNRLSIWCTNNGVMANNGSILSLHAQQKR